MITKLLDYVVLIQVEKFANRTYDGYPLEPYWVIYNERWKPPLAPLLFTTFLARFNTVFEARLFSSGATQRNGGEKVELIERTISDSTIRAYVYALAKFLSYLEECRLEDQTPGMHASTSCSERFVNHYLNAVLARRLKSPSSLATHRSALIAYYNFLHYMEFTPRLRLEISRRTRQAMAESSTKQHYIQYIPRHSRSALIGHCRTLAEKLMMRMGFEVGLRTSELPGLRIPALQKLFLQLNNKDFENVELFKFWLEGRYTKTGKSRWIYFDRELLRDMQRYYETERQWLIDASASNHESFFLRTDQGGLGKEISKSHATNVFRKRAKAAGLKPEFSFHDLRHTFATELFHEEVTGPEGRETRSESAALIVVAQRLGHSITKNGHAPEVTTRYIRMRIQMQEMEGIF
ncbi:MULTISPECIES: site-specific integrase [unclassified Marinobacter]|uniref:tyrosine-type recombinase/integrase n=1 Tax=uncultured Marinobacter sp. TaxID=187379 RepID=UPI001D129B62|tara:strand:- start:1403 stop:2623 length:1221 start_codon:yes stop_codon:yes gene_type:complete